MDLLPYIIKNTLIFNVHLRGGRIGTPYRGLSHDAIWEFKESEERRYFEYTKAQVVEGTFSSDIELVTSANSMEI